MTELLEQGRIARSRVEQLRMKDRSGLALATARMTAAQLLPGLERKLKAEITGDVMFDRFSRGRYATDASHYQMMPLGVVAPRTVAEAERAHRDRARGGRERAAARRRHLAVRPDRRTSRWSSTARSTYADLRARHRRPALHGRARHRARRPQPHAQALRPLVPGRRLDRLARHHRRHDGEQFLRRPLAALRHDARQRALDRRGAGRRHQGAFRPGVGRPLEPAGRLAVAAARARPARHRAARGRRDRDALPEGAAPRRRLQSRRASRRTRRSTISRTSCSARKARSRSRPASS